MVLQPRHSPWRRSWLVEHVSRLHFRLPDPPVSQRWLPAGALSGRGPLECGIKYHSVRLLLGSLALERQALLPFAVRVDGGRQGRRLWCLEQGSGTPMTWRAFKREMSWWTSSFDLEATKKFNLAARWLLRQSGTVRQRGEEFLPLAYQKEVTHQGPASRWSLWRKTPWQV